MENSGSKKYKILCVDEDGKSCNIELHDLIDHILTEVQKMPKTICIENPDEWTAKKGMFFNEKIDISTNRGIYTKASTKPAIITLSKFYDSNKHICERLIFLSKSRSGAAYWSPDGIQHPNVDTIEYENDIWYYTISLEDLKLSSNGAVSQCSNYIFENVTDCLVNVLKTAQITPGKNYTIFPANGDIAMAVGALYPDDVMSAPIIFDTKGNLACNSVIELSKER